MEKDLPTVPEEVLLQILPHLDAVSLARFSMMCKFLYETIKDSPLMEYTIHLHLDGVVDTRKAITQPYSKLVELLVRRRQAYMSLNWTITATVQMWSPCLTYNLVGGMFATDAQTRLELGVLPLSGSVDNYRFAVNRPRKIGFLIRNFTMDTTQDLVVLVEDDIYRSEPENMFGPVEVETWPRTVHTHLRTIHTDDPHPLARVSSLQFVITPDKFGNHINTSVLHIAGKILAHYYFGGYDPGESQPRVLIWDWTTSELILDSSNFSPPLLPTFLSGFALLDSTYFFVTSESNSGSIQLYRISRAASSTHSALHLATLHFPPTAPDVKIWQLTSHAGPTEPHIHSPTPFIRVNDDDRLHVFTINYEYPSARFAGEHNIPNLKSLDLFVHQRVFAKYCTQKSSDNNLVVDIPWVEWGPPNTKIISPSCMQDVNPGLRDVHGQRVILPKYGKDAWRPSKTDSVEILDFSLAAILSVSGAPLPASEDCAGTLVSSSKILASENPVFQEDVEAHLPCVSFIPNLGKSYFTFMIHADGFIGINMGERWGNAIVDAYKF